MNNDELSTPNTSHATTASTAKDQHETVSLLDRNIIAAKLAALKTEIDATLRLLSNNEKPFKTQQLEKLIMRQSDLLDAALNRRTT